MAFEIEHKYLVKDDSYKLLSTSSSEIKQGYLNREKGRTVRVRLRDRRAYITIKGANKGDVRPEFEYEIPLSDGVQLLELCVQPVIEKTRHLVPFEGNVWEVDEFHGSLEGLVMAELELSTPDQAYKLPSFIGKNVTDDRRYYNSQLGKTPVSELID